MDQLLSNRHLFENSLLQALLEEGGTPFGLTLLNQEGYLIFVNQVAALHYNLQKELVSDHLHFQHLFSALADLRKTVTSCLEGKQEQFSLGTVKIKDRFLSIQGRAPK